MSDPYFSSVSLLLHCDGADSGTTFVDDSSNGFTVTRTGAKTKTAAAKFGSAGAHFTATGSTDVLSVAHDASLQANTEDFTLELWFYLTTKSVFQVLYAKNAPSYTFSYSLDITGGNKVRLMVDRSPSGTTYLYSTTTVNTGAWYFVQARRYGGVLSLGINGTKEAESSDLSPLTIVDSTAAVTIGNWYTGTSVLNGYIDDIRFTKGVARAFALPTAAFENAPAPDGDSRLLANGPLGSPSILFVGNTFGLVLVPGPLGLPALRVDRAALVIALAHGPLGAPEIRAGPSTSVRLLTRGPLGAARIQGYTDFTSFIVESTLKFVADFDTPDGVVRIPISSWQATLQTNGASYVQCVVPAVTPWLDTLIVATSFRILRRGVLNDGSLIYVEIAAGPMQTVAMNQGSFNFTATISGYGPAYDPNTDPDPLFDRTLIGPRQRTTSTNSLRVQCSIDWLLKPGMRAWLNGDSFIVSYMNLYATSDGDVHMEVGSGAS